MSCEFSLPFGGIQSALSANNTFVSAVTAGNRLTVRNTSNLEVNNIFQCVDKIDKIEISPDNCYILCALYSRNVVQVFSIEDKDWKCRINEGVAGMINAYWTPDSRNVVVESDFGIQVSIWSLTDSNSVIISLPKPPAGIYSKISAFSDCGRFYALVHRIELQDMIGVYSVASQSSLGMNEVSKFRARSNDVASVYWVPGGTHLITLDSPLSYKFCAYTPMGECIATYEAYQNALGIRCVALPKSSHGANVTTAAGVSNNTNAECRFIALGSFDGKVRLLSVYSWQMAFALPLLHPRDLDAGFNAGALLCTVEVSAAAASRLKAGTTATATSFTTTGSAGAVGNNGSAEEENGTAEVTAIEGEEAPATVVKQHQLPPLRQLLSSLPYNTTLHQRVLYDRNGDVIIPGGSGGSGSGSGGGSSSRPSVTSAARGATTVGPEEGSARAEEDSAWQCMESYFALRNVKSLPKAQVFVLDTKRHSVAAAATRRAMNATAGAAGGSTTTSGSTTSSGSGGFPAVGVSWVGWSQSGQLLAARDEAHPRCVWVWRPLQAQLVAVLVLLENVTCARWRPPLLATVTATTATDTTLPAAPSTPSKNSTSSAVPPAPPVPSTSTTTAAPLVGEEAEVLAFCTGTARVYFWTPSAGVTFADTATLATGESDSSNQSFAVTSLLWSKDGRSLLLRGKEAHSLCRVVLPTAQLR